MMDNMDSPEIFSSACVFASLKVIPFRIYVVHQYIPQYEMILQTDTNFLKPWAQGYKAFFMLNSAEHELFYANHYENANNSWHFHIYQQRNVNAQLCLA